MSDRELYGCGNVPRAGDLVEFGAQGGQMLVSRIDPDDQSRMWVGSTHYPVHLAVLVARHGEPDPAFRNSDKS
jgi:hypothetical protein